MALFFLPLPPAVMDCAAAVTSFTSAVVAISCADGVVALFFNEFSLLLS